VDGYHLGHVIAAFVIPCLFFAAWEISLAHARWVLKQKRRGEGNG